MLMRGYREKFFPPKSNCTIWRYFDFTKFVSLLESGKLVFPRADKFEDPYEGALSQAGVRLLRDPETSPRLPPEAVETLVEHSPWMQKAIFMSCWYVGDHESAAMWKLYLQSSEGVAIRTDYNTLAAVLEDAPQNAVISLVEYIDYEKIPIPLHNMLYKYLHKRLSFSHENELRAIIWSWDHINKSQIPSDSTSVAVPVPLDRLLHAIHVAPTAKPWFGELVEQVTRRYGLNTPVIRSNLYDRPTY